MQSERLGSGLNKYRWWIVLGAIALTLGTVAFAVAQTGQRPTPAEIPTVVTDRPTAVNAVAGTAAAVSSVATPTPVGQEQAAPAEKPTSAEPGGSGTSSSAKSSSARRSAAKAKPPAKSEDAEEEDSDSREVVAPAVREEIDHEDGEEQEEEAHDGDKKDGGFSTQSVRSVTETGKRKKTHRRSH